MSEPRPLRIQFLVSSSEAGRDGVGDYARSLAEECTRLGHACSILALNDKYLSSGYSFTRGTIPELRCASTLELDQKRTRSLEFMREFQPDWTSLQFVSYGHHPKGMVPSGLAQMIAELSPASRHVMMHEIWIGVAREASLKEKAIGWLQRRSICSLLRQYDAQILHTSNQAYAEILGNEGFDVESLRLFGNIPVTGSRPDLQATGLSRWITHRERMLVAVCFGTLHPQWNAQQTALWMRETASLLGKTPVVISMGRAGHHAAQVLAPLRAAGIQTIETGELASEEVSLVMQEADLGIAPHPWALIGKSGAAAAMLDHGLPVLVPRNDWTPRLPGFSPESGTSLLRQLTEIPPTSAPEWLSGKKSAYPSRPLVAAQFIESLKDKRKP